MRRVPPKTWLQLESLEHRCVPTYAIVDLGIFNPSVINNAGQIAGSANGDAALWQNGAITDLGTQGQAKDLNDTGQVVGKGSGAFLWGSGSGLRPLGFNVAFGVNASSQVAGTGMGSYYSSGYSVPHAYFWTQNGPRDITSLLGDGSAEAHAISDAGQVVGWTQHYIFIDSFNLIGTGWQTISNRAYLWDSTSSTNTLLGSLPGDSASRALDINNQGQVIGTSGNIYGVRLKGYLYFPREGFIWQNGVMTDLGMPTASGLNNLGQVVGGKYEWNNGALTDLNSQIDPSSGWVVTSASDINDEGQIIGQGMLNGQTHYFLMTPGDPNGPAAFAVSSFPSLTTAGAAGSFTVTALNGDGTTAAGYRGTVYFTSSDPHAGLPGMYTFTAADAGAHTFSATLTTAGTQAITATDTSGGITGSDGGITVQAGPASKLTVTGFPAVISAGFSGGFTVRAVDTYGNPASGYNGAIHFTSSDPQAVLPGDYTFSGNSAQSFSAMLKTADAQAIMATDTVMSGLAGTDSGIQVYPAAAAVLRITGPYSLRSGTTFSITVTAYDAYGNIATGYAGTVFFKSSDPGAKLPASYAFTAGDQGVHGFSMILKKKGTQTISVSDTLTPALTASLSVNVT